MRAYAPIIGWLVIASGGVAGFYLRKHQLTVRWLFATLTCGFVLGLLACGFMEYSSPTVKLLGFPFVAAVFERSPSGGWADFVGLKTYYATVGNFLFGLSIALLPSALAVWIRGRRTELTKSLHSAPR